MEEHRAKRIVREGYARVARMAENNATCCRRDSCCEIGCDTSSYSQEELRSIPGGADLGLGCGNPAAMASIKEGETVVDLGCGAGVDCFLAANKVGASGSVIGVDMTPEMIDLARRNAKRGNWDNVEFRLGEIENLPIADGTAHLVISNCVINLSRNKDRVFQEAFRVLKPGGRIMISDIVLLRELPEEIRQDERAYVGCVSGAVMKERYLECMARAGFEHIRLIQEKELSVENIQIGPEGRTLAESGAATRRWADLVGSIASIQVTGYRPQQ